MCSHPRRTQVDLGDFSDRLAASLAWKLRTHAANFAAYSMPAFALGLFPWHGYIEPSFLTTAATCAERQVGDWKLYNFTQTNGWPEVVALGTWMRSFYERDRIANAELLFGVGARVLNCQDVQRALGMFNLTPSFYVSVFNPDNARSKNYCSV